MNFRNASRALPAPSPLRPAYPTRRLRNFSVAMVGALMAFAGAGVHAGDCRISTTSVNFGAYDPITGTSPVDSAGAVHVDCTPGLFELLFGVYVTLSLNQGSSGSYAGRTMRQAPASTLRYNLYTTASRTTIWGDGSGGTGVVTGQVGGFWSGQPTPRTFPVYGRIPAGQDPNLGLHSDQIIVTVTF